MNGPPRVPHPEDGILGVLVLVVDDDAPSRELVMDILSDAGYSVRGVDGAEAARTAIAQLPPRAVVLDLYTPKCDGISFCRWLRARAGSIASVPVIFLSASGSLREQLDALRAGGNDFLSKPVDEKTLLAKLKNALSMAGLIEQATGVGERHSRRYRS